MSETCARDNRRSRLLASRLNGLDEVEVMDDRRTLLVRFFHDAPEGLTAANLRITGGVAVRHIHILDVVQVSSDDPDVTTLVKATLDRSGDASIYRLHVAGIDGIDQRYTDAPFVFFPDADDGVDCSGAATPAPSSVTPPHVNYLAKDYAGFRQVMLDRLAVTLPEWRETHIPDFGVMLVELLAYVADRLSYYQDAVATEAYLSTARRRISVRRHVRLIDYAMHEGCNARALVQIEPEADGAITPSTLKFLAGLDDKIFLPLAVPDTQMEVREAHTKMSVHCWGDTNCVLPKGAVSVTLVDDHPENPTVLKAGDFLILEIVIPETVANTTQLIPDADPSKRHAVRLIAVEPLRDELLHVALLKVSWSAEDALPADFPLHSSGGGPITVVRGNLLLADHGSRRTDGDWSSGHPVKPTIGPGHRRTIALSGVGLTFADAVSTGDSAQRVLAQRDPRSATPAIMRMQSWPKRQPEEDPKLRATELAASDWKIQPDLIESGPDDPHATVEIDDDGRAILRFGDGVNGRDPTGQEFEIVYRVGNGSAGNVGADKIVQVLQTRVDSNGIEQVSSLAGTHVRNPLPASGGADQEDVQQVKLLAPSIQTTLFHAITADDYAVLAKRLEPEVQRAVCSLVRSGGRQVTRIALDRFGSDEPDEALQRRVAQALEPYRRVGHDVEVVNAEYVPLLLILRVELLANYTQIHLRAALRAALGTGVLPNGSLAEFHPDKLTFGTPIYGSRLIAIAQAVRGVRTVTLVELARQFDRERGVYGAGVLKMAWNEVPQLDNDPLRPDRGLLVLQLIGGLA
jgi:hypothetical protein